jgi:NAD/NADP transhydrogenase beta subunit
MLLGGAAALTLAAAVAHLPARARTLPLAAGSTHFACAGACAAIAYAAGLEQGLAAVVIVSAMAALIGAHLSIAVAGDAWPSFVTALDGYAACSVAAVGVGTGDGALLVTGVTLTIACAASHARASEARTACSR